MKIAVASENEKVSEHFGHCSNFNVYEIKDNEISNSRILENPGNGHNLITEFLNNIGVKVVIAGGMGKGAREALGEKNIEIVTGASGLATESVKKYLKGELVSIDKECTEHKFEKQCSGNCHNK